METVFDHGITKEEKDELIPRTSKEEYLSFFDQDESYFIIALLYHLRRNNKAMMKYVKKLSPKRRNDFIGMYVSECD